MRIIEGKEYSDEKLELITDYFHLSSEQLDMIIETANKRKPHRHSVFMPTLEWIEDRPELLDDPEGFRVTLDCIEEVYCGDV